MQNKKILLASVLGIILVTAVAAIGALLLYMYLTNNQKLAAINSFEDCAAAGYPILDSFPEQCNTPDGRHFTRKLTPEEEELVKPPSQGSGSGSQREENPAYYGSSTKASCNMDSDCTTGGCNQEVCGSKNEVGGLVTICLAPQKPTPDKAGYKCGCSANQCAWKR